ncbi:hypothetical protein [Rhizobium herbae]|uniref:Serine/threonine-protein kinase RIO1 n=1 Tax=Rhizobium herbae TaxID=508661 RepID=A0ABS4ETB6_9HYPH|nr:hypothetical protein [Rhizobium herbae]MBP1861194.1 serine/threonine-protein kinase RIO1 [Rhizobium herbae]
MGAISSPAPIKSAWGIGRFPKLRVYHGYEQAKETIVAKTFDLSDFSEDELTALIDEATRLRQTRRSSRDRELSPAADGSKGQDVRDPNHGAITAPTPREVKEEGPAHGVPHKARGTGA